MDFKYEEAFSRNIGWLTHTEQQRLNTKCIAIAGLGGVGGSHLLTLTRLGIGSFHISDFDTFELPNFNRQVGATMSSINKEKTSVLASMALDINPNLKLSIFDKGIDESNVEEFLKGVDLYIDGLDFFAFSARKAVFAACARLKIPAITVAPLGMGAALLNFLPGQMTFDEYFNWKNCSEEEMGQRFFDGLAPTKLQQESLVDPETIDFKNQHGPSTIMGCSLSSAIAASEALKILLERGKVIAAPKGVHFDAYQNKVVIW